MSVTILLYHLVQYISDHNLLFTQKKSEKWTDGMKETIVCSVVEQSTYDEHSAPYVGEFTIFMKLVGKRGFGPISCKADTLRFL